MKRLRHVVKRTKGIHTHIVVHKNTHAALKAFATSRNTTMVDATQYLIEKALRAEYSENDGNHA